MLEVGIRLGCRRYAREVLLLNLDHVGMAVRDLDAAIEEFRRRFGVEPISRETVVDQGVEEAMIAIGGSHVQLLQPLADDTPVGRFLERRGEGLHHIAYAVADIEAALEHLRREGAELIDRGPRIGGGGHRIAFVHPKSASGVLTELVELR
jgi:methylmalonyl-CoA epimerase